MSNISAINHRLWVNCGSGMITPSKRDQKSGPMTSTTSLCIATASKIKWRHIMTLHLSYKHTERQRQRPMLFNGDAWKSVPDPIPKRHHWPALAAAADARRGYTRSTALRSYFHFMFSLRPPNLSNFRELKRGFRRSELAVTLALSVTVKQWSHWNDEW